MWTSLRLPASCQKNHFFIFSVLHNGQQSSVGDVSLIGFLAMISSPCISIPYCSGVIARASDVVRGQLGKIYRRTTEYMQQRDADHNTSFHAGSDGAAEPELLKALRAACGCEEPPLWAFIRKAFRRRRAADPGHDL